MKTELIELYKDSLLLGKYIELERVANGMLPALFPGRALEELSDEELVSLTKAVITGMTSWLC
ncbi:hypothetical protein EGC31_22565 [Escherichia coli]|uniref:hypothetical protein n=1 Tax=Escherichia coli TaxID=562 RepID=UPI000B7E5082|nr:hypothetical protein [Escherichia coli]EFN7626073.1 hypothetical protein [Escherichia coli]EFN7642367.1 hypothetical protein [Escherichia coli]EID7190154.1 hypothetical protein [Escherichia coli]ELD0526785.1 hypothetical protein [Escherichia coli]ELO3378880.1 hypothetical protein [Escherichia coli]